MKKETINNVVSKWKTTGLLKELPEEKTEKCAEALEKTLCLLLKRKNKKIKNDNNTSLPSNEFIAATLIPIIRRIYNYDIKYTPTNLVNFVYKDYIKFLQEKYDITRKTYYNDKKINSNKVEKIVCDDYINYFISHYIQLKNYEK